LQQIRAISLDLDDTLWEIGPVIRRAEAALWQWLVENYPRISEGWTPDTLTELRLQIAARNPDRAHDFRFMRKMALAHVAESSGYSSVLVEPAFAVFDAERNAVELYPDVEAALGWLARHYTLVAATNGNANLRAIGIDHYFDHVVTSVMAGAAKPAQAVFDLVSRLSGVSHAQVLHVGDHPDTDVDGARRAGMTAVWMNRAGGEWPETAFRPDAEIADFAELRALLEPHAGVG